MYRPLDQPEHCASVDSEGRYELSHDGGRPGAVARAPGHAPTYFPGRYSELLEVREENEGEVMVNFTLGRARHFLRGVVLDVGGGPIPGASVEAGGLRGTTAADGSFELPYNGSGAPAFASALAEGYAPGEGRNESMDSPYYTVRLHPGIEVAGVVQVTEGGPVAGARVLALPVGPGIHFWADAPRAITDGDGRFRFEALRAGTYRFSASTEAGQGEREVTLRLGEDAGRIVVPFVMGHEVRGEVLFADSNKPCVGGSVSLRSSARNYGGSIADTGQVELRGVEPGKYQVEVKCDGAIADSAHSLSVDVTEDLAGLRWFVRQGATVRGTVVHPDGRPAEGYYVHFVRTRFYELTGEVDAEGRFEIQGVPEMRFSLRVSRESHRASYGPEKGPFEARAGETVTVNLVLDPVGRVVGRVLDTKGAPVDWAQTYVFDEQGERVSYDLTGQSGRYSHSSVLPGTYWVWAERRQETYRPVAPPTDPRYRIEVKAGESTNFDFTLEAIDGRIEGVVLDKDGRPVAGAVVTWTRREARDTLKHALMRTRDSLHRPLTELTTDSDGAFSIEGLAAGDYVVVVSDNQQSEAYAPLVQTGDSVEIVLDRGRELTVRAKAPSGERARVLGALSLVVRNVETGLARYVSLQGQGSTVVSGLPAGEYRVTIQGDEHYGSKIIRIAGAKPPPVVVSLRRTASVAGRIVHSTTGNPFPEAFVNFRSTAEEPDGVTLYKATGADGLFVIRHLPEAEGELSISSMRSPREFQRVEIPFTPVPGKRVELGDIKLHPKEAD